MRFTSLFTCLALIISAQALAQETQQLPPGGESIMDTAPASLGTGVEENGTVEIVDAEGPGFTKALRFTINKAGEVWQVNRSVAIPRPFKKGEAVGLSFWARTVKTRRETGQGIVHVHLSEGTGPWREEVGRFTTFPNEWTQFFARGVFSSDYPANHMHLKLFAGSVEQTIEIGGISVQSYGVGFDVNKLPQTRSSYEGMEDSAPWRKLADERIEQVRTAPFEIQVIGQDGKPVPDAQVNIELLSHAFQFGTAIDAHDIINGKEKKHDIQRQKMVELFNAGTFYNHLKWEAWIGDWGEHHAKQTTLSALHWFRDNNLAFRGHVMVWPSFRNLPKFIKDMEGKNPDPKALEQLVLSRIDDVAAQTAGLVEEWDVVNEPYDNHDLMDLCGKQVMVDWFKRARERLPDTALTLNDYSLLTPLNDSPKQQFYLDLVQYLKDNGADVDVMGLQGHFGGMVPGPERMYSTLERFSKLGTAIRITEYDLASDEDELEYAFTRDLLITLYSHPSVIGWQTWGIYNIINDDGSLTPEGKAFYELVHGKWKTRIAAQTDDAGRLSSRGHLGRYRITVTSGERTAETFMDLRKGAAPQIVTLP